MIKYFLVLGMLLAPGLINNSLYAAASYTNLEEVRIERQQKELDEQLYDAAKYDTLEEVQAIVARMNTLGLDINQASYNGYRPLNAAAEMLGKKEERIEILRYLLSEGCSPLIGDVDGKTPIVVAIVNSRNIAAVGLLVESGANADEGLRVARDLLQQMNASIIAERECIEQEGIAEEHSMLEKYNRDFNLFRELVNYLESVVNP